MSFQESGPQQREQTDTLSKGEKDIAECKKLADKIEGDPLLDQERTETCRDVTEAAGEQLPSTIMTKALENGLDGLTKEEIQTVQRMLEEDDDGIIGPKTRAAYETYKTKQLVEKSQNIPAETATAKESLSPDKNAQQQVEATDQPPAETSEKVHSRESVEAKEEGETQTETIERKGVELARADEKLEGAVGTLKKIERQKALLKMSEKLGIKADTASEIITSLTELGTLTEEEGPRLVIKLQKLSQQYGEDYKSVYEEAMKYAALSPALAYLQKPAIAKTLSKVSVVGGISLWSTLIQKETWTKFDKPNLNTLSTGNGAFDTASYMVPIAGNIKDFNDARLAWPDRKAEAVLSVTAGTIGMVMDGISLLGITAPAAQGAKLGVKATIRGTILATRKIGKWMAKETGKNIWDALTFKAFRSSLKKAPQSAARGAGGRTETARAQPVKAEEQPTSQKAIEKISEELDKKTETASEIAGLEDLVETTDTTNVPAKSAKFAGTPSEQFLAWKRQKEAEKAGVKSEAEKKADEVRERLNREQAQEARDRAAKEAWNKAAAKKQGPTFDDLTDRKIKPEESPSAPKEREISDLLKKQADEVTINFKQEDYARIKDPQERIQTMLSDAKIAMKHRNLSEGEIKYGLSSLEKRLNKEYMNSPAGKRLSKEERDRISDKDQANFEEGMASADNRGTEFQDANKQTDEFMIGKDEAEKSGGGSIFGETSHEIKVPDLSQPGQHGDVDFGSHGGRHDQVSSGLHQ